MKELKHSFSNESKHGLLLSSKNFTYCKAMLKNEDKERLALAERVGSAIKSLGRGGKRRVSEKCGVSEQAVTGWCKTGRIDKKNLMVVSEMTGISIATLIKGNHLEANDDKHCQESRPIYCNIDTWHPSDPIPDGFVSVDKWKVSFSAGNGHTVSYELIEDGQPAIYRMEWFQRERINPKRTRRFDVIGDSMEPFLFGGDTILVDTSETDLNCIIDGRVYAIRYGNELRIKRLFRKLDGTIVLRSDNPSYQDENVAPELVSEHIALIGRVRDRSGGGGL